MNSSAPKENIENNLPETKEEVKISLFKKIIEFFTGFKSRYLKKKKRKEVKKKLKEEKQRMEKFYKKLEELYSFMKWIDKQLGNRKNRKLFWADFIKNGNVRNQFMNNLIMNYNPEKEKKNNEK